MQRTGRATVTIHSDRYAGKEVDHWYVMAEGTVEFTERDALPLTRMSGFTFGGRLP